jgi:hypothetical protein
LDISCCEPLASPNLEPSLSCQPSVRESRSVVLGPRFITLVQRTSCPPNHQNCHHYAEAQVSQILQLTARRPRLLQLGSSQTHQPTLAISDTAFSQAFDQPRFEVRREVTIKDIARALSETHPWKAPGEDLIPTGLINACGRPLFQILAVLYTRCLELQWYPPRFKRAKTVVLAKPGKSPATCERRVASGEAQGHCKC